MHGVVEEDFGGDGGGGTEADVVMLKDFGGEGEGDIEVEVVQGVVEDFGDVGGT